MAYPPSQQVPDSIDQVIQSGHSLDQVKTRGSQSHSNISMNRIAPLLPLPQTSASSRRDDNMRPNSHSSYEDQRAGSSGRGSDRESPKTMSTRHSDSRSSRTGQTTVVNGPGRDNMADFFSWEVFQIVLHNPTTAHRFLRFCQSRACGENMEFLQQVRHISCRDECPILLCMEKFFILTIPDRQV